MRQSTLFMPPPEFAARLEELKVRPGLNAVTAELLLHVELAFQLMGQLGLDDEPVTAVWAVLSGMFIRDPRLDALTNRGRRALANARQIIPYSGRFAWSTALRSYIRDIPLTYRNYHFDSNALDEQIINAARREADTLHHEHETLYQDCLSGHLPYQQRQRRFVKPGVPYEFHAQTDDRTASIRVQFTEAHVACAAQVSTEWFAESPVRAPFSLWISNLEDIAIWLDDREASLAAQYGWHPSEYGQWHKRYETINFHTIREGGTLNQRNDHPLILNGFTHLAGMVGSGKSTLAQLMAAYILSTRPDLRMTIVVGDVQTAIRLANQINWWFRDTPEHDTPVAVPLIGRSRRDIHLRGLYQSKDFKAHKERQQGHWGERWLSTACPVQSLLDPEQIMISLDGKPFVPGTEPCQDFRKPPTKKRPYPGPRHLCPFFATCPSQHMYRDMPSASIWITTPGALGMSGPPRHVETRPIKIGELVYEQSDIVVFDEADTIIQWFDNLYAETVVLANGNNGLLDEIGAPIADYVKNNRVALPPTQRWTWAERSAEHAVSAILTLLDEHLGHGFLRQWIKRGYFTPNTLCYRIARLILGYPEVDEHHAPLSVIESRNQETQNVVHYFECLLDMDDPLAIDQSAGIPEPVVQLSHIMQQINNNGESAVDDHIHTLCRQWLTRFFSGVEHRLERLRTLQENQDQAQSTPSRRKRFKDEAYGETVDSLAYRLQFTLSLALLDRHARIVFYEWESRPNTITKEQPHRRMPRAMLDILPLPPTGRQFGTYYAQQPLESGRSNNHLSLFAYTNVGRAYILNYHRLLTDLTGIAGPHVVALSGTSYLPDSTAFHVSDPEGTLLPDERSQAAIGQSSFAFIPQVSTNNTIIRISGKPEHQKAGLFREMVRALVAEDELGHLGQELGRLRDLGTTKPERWADRARMLLFVNSYEQARWAADALRSYWPSQAKNIFHLRRIDTASNGDNGVQSVSDHGGINRSDIESFAQTGGIILVAPLNAIGRGFNIRNSTGKAAFGAAYFLTRPYPHPNDTQAIAQEVNRRAFDWANTPHFKAWRGDGVLGKATLICSIASSYWRSVEQRSYYGTLYDDPEVLSYPRNDLAATTAGYVVQAVGRLVRGNVPFHAYFVDAAWAPHSADPDSIEPDTEETSLLVAMMLRLAAYAADEETVGWALYKPLADALENTAHVRW